MRPDLTIHAGGGAAVLGDTELPDVLIPSGPKPACLGAWVDNLTGLVDDLAILVSAKSIDGPGGTLALGGPCWVRWAVAAFDAAGGEDYGNGKVPVENLMRELRR